ncbi:glycosyltransferase family 4 protein [Prosthecomicrobium sp. N25]|uniref:glycosyltransferase family 4 protein n=1 Tax=Prosthecomicrobium sp. N25 TaxID=3129254 RepID=UPI0030780244
MGIWHAITGHSRQRRAVLGSGLFDAAYYLSQFKDSREIPADPLAHFLAAGWKQGRQPNPVFHTAWYRSRHLGTRRKVNPLLHYIASGWKAGLAPHPLFDPRWYLARYPDLQKKPLDPLLHFLRHGSAELRDPNPLFDAAHYVARHRTPEPTSLSALAHYISANGDPAAVSLPLFDAGAYLWNNPDVEQSTLTPLGHYLQHGRHENRRMVLNGAARSRMDLAEGRPTAGPIPLAMGLPAATAVAPPPPAGAIAEPAPPAAAAPAGAPAPFRSILVVSQYCPSRAHAGGLRILDLYRFIKSRWPGLRVDLYTHPRPGIDWSYADAEALFDAVHYAATEDLTAAEITRLAGGRHYDVVDYQFVHAGRDHRAMRAIGDRFLFTPMEVLTRSLHIAAQSADRRKVFNRIPHFATTLAAAAAEVDLTHAVDWTVCVSRSDAAFLRAITGRRTIQPIETGLSGLEFDLDRLARETPPAPSGKRNVIVYVAYFGSDTNVQALDWLLREVHPRIRDAVPDYRLDVVGRGDLEPFRALADEAVELVGEVPDLAPFIARAKVGIAPALGGAGFRGKVNQYALFGVPSVVSRLAAKGLAYRDGSDILVADGPEDFARGCIRLLQDGPYADHMARRAKETCLARYTWAGQADRIAKVYGLPR